MADGVTFSSAAGPATIPHGSIVWTDEVAIGASTMHAQIVKLADPTLDSTAMMGVTSGGLNVAIVNTTIPISGNSTSIISTASAIRIDSTAALAISGNSTAIISTASIIRVDTIASLPNLSTGSIIRIDTVAGTVGISGNTTSIISTASKIQAELINTGIGGSSASPLYVTLQPMTQAAGSTFSNSSITSTALVTPFSSAASTRFNLTGIVATNKGAALTIMNIWTGSSGGTLLFRQALASAGGGFSWQGLIASPYGTTGAQITVECVPASTVYLHLDAYRSS